jgi:hypothetical protein
MKRVITLALLAFALASFPPVQNASETSRGKGQEPSPTRASASPESLDFGDQALVHLAARAHKQMNE